MSSYILALDFDWEGTKAAIFTSDLDQVGMAFEESSLLQPESGQAFLEPQDLVGSAQRTIRRTLDEANLKGEDIGVIGLAGEMGGLLGVDKDGNAMTPYITSLDTRSSKCLDLMQAKDGPEIVKLSGGANGLQGAQILWWKNQDEHTYFKIAKFVTGYAYIGMQMCGLSADQAFYDYTGFAESGFGDAVYKTWSPEILHKFDLSEDKLPKVVAPTDIIGTVSEAFAKESGLAVGTKVTAGCATVAAALLGAQIVKPGAVGQFTGALSVVAGVVTGHKADAEHGIADVRMPVGDNWYALAYTSGSGLAERWFKDTLTGSVEAGYQQLDDEAKGVAPGSDGVFFVPHFVNAKSAAKGAFVGLDWKATRAFLYRALLEGIAYEKCLVLKDMFAIYGDLDQSTLNAVDGAERGSLCNQIEADVTGLTVVPMQVKDPALAGCAAVAGQAAGFIQDATAAVPKPEAQAAKAPDAKTHEAYQPCVKAYSDLVSLLNGFDPKRD